MEDFELVIITITIVSFLFSGVAIIVSPLLANYVQRKSQRSMWQKQIFATLISNRGQLSSEHHVNALNTLIVAFDKNNKKDKKVRDAFYKFSEISTELDDHADEPNIKEWNSRLHNAHSELLSEFSKRLGYHADYASVKRLGYNPQGPLTDRKNEYDLRVSTLEFHEEMKKMVGAYISVQALAMHRREELEGKTL